MYMATQIADGMRSCQNHDDNDDVDDDDDADDNDDNDGILMKLLTTFRLQLLGEYFNYFLRLIKILLAATWSIF